MRVPKTNVAQGHLHTCIITQRLCTLVKRLPCASML